MKTIRYACIYIISYYSRIANVLFYCNIFVLTSDWQYCSIVSKIWIYYHIHTSFKLAATYLCARHSAILHGNQESVIIVIARLNIPCDISQVHVLMYVKSISISTPDTCAQLRIHFIPENKINPLSSRETDTSTRTHYHRVNQWNTYWSLQGSPSVLFMICFVLFRGILAWAIV